MLRVFKGIIVVGFYFFITVVSAQASPITRLSLLLNQFKTYRAQFDQEVFSSKKLLLSTSSGNVMMKRPGKFRWETYRPTHQIVLTNGVVLWNYNVDLMQATAHIVKGAVGFNAAMLLTGDTEKLLHQFQVTQLPSPKHGMLFQLTPMKSNHSFVWVKLVFDQNQQLRQLQLLNNLDQLVIFSFYKIKINSPINDAQFTFKPPAGVDVVKQ